jgi:hypothetical protein
MHIADDCPFVNGSMAKERLESPRTSYEGRFGERPRIRAELQAGRWEEQPFAEFWHPVSDQLYVMIPHRMCEVELFRQLRVRGVVE